ncbi:hypothetical protein PF005_g13737 [Phytophthora fragariae]|uniref:Uncharacterized protein n=1 Tax=Phytophthora fragariae TaxID=53985 RepID=A0A6A3ZC38_9STRA|nr:hypothetical protein PF003_g18655 [Phytophthora fragariae]KAE9007551.1 hypothetical protein PF011_g11076 [Phytophthora fragariae]KAE9109715.1 hypothetical protein PF007_g12142 [Phytophthora fragariae]KAE9204586.1 hypothetical protein PF005_g13737 [Phytophthora fragariae]KAE9232621.1 hypothetical protein PF002_g12311 [Phytophthora fragariae]
MADIGTPTERRDALLADLTVDEVDDQLVPAAANSSPGHDGAVTTSTRRSYILERVPFP